MSKKHNPERIKTIIDQYTNGQPVTHLRVEHRIPRESGFPAGEHERIWGIVNDGTGYHYFLDYPSGVGFVRDVRADADDWRRDCEATGVGCRDDAGCLKRRGELERRPRRRIKNEFLGLATIPNFGGKRACDRHDGGDCQ